MNIVDLIKDQLSGDALSKLGGVIGQSEESTREATDVAVPSLLSILMKLVTGGGAGKLADLLKNLDLGALGGLLSNDPAAASKKGTDVLGSLLGGGTLAAVLAGLAKMTGVNQDSMKKLLGYLLPLILKTISGQFGGAAPTAQGLTTLFEQQKGNIKAAMPAGFSVPELPNVSGGGLPRWLLPLAAAVILGLVAWNFLTPAPDPQPEPAAGGPSDMAPEGPIILKDLPGVFDDTTNALLSVKGPETVDQALPKLEEASTTLDRLKGLWEKVPATSRAAIVAAATEGLAKLKDLSAKVLEIPGVGEKLKPVLDAILAKIAEFTTA